VDLHGPVEYVVQDCRAEEFDVGNLLPRRGESLRIRDPRRVRRNPTSCTPLLLRESASGDSVMLLR